MQIISIRGTPGSPPIGAILNISTSLGGEDIEPSHLFDEDILSTRLSEGI